MTRTEVLKEMGLLERVKYLAKDRIKDIDKSEGLLSMFHFCNTKEGVEHWWNVHDQIESKINE